MTAGETRVAVLTPPGTGAIATIEVAGDRAWEFARTLFRPAGKPLPETPEVNRLWFGRMGDGAGDEVILAVPERGASAHCAQTKTQWADAPRSVEIHCHGGRRVVRWVVEQFVTLGCVEEGEPAPSGPVLPLLQRAPTLRTAGILLDQLHGAFEKAITCILAFPTLAGLGELAALAPVGRHLVEPWKVAVAGAPNVGKSSLVNALAGYQRAVVSEVAGTTRDAVSVQLAFDGWPVELTDTAGLRDAEGLEAEGIERARRVLADADLVLWVMDGTADRPVFPDPESEAAAGLPLFNWILVVNKTDLPAGWDLSLAHNATPVSATTGSGLSALIERTVAHLVRRAPPPGGAVPYTPRLADAVEAAHAALTSGNTAEAARLLRDCLPPR